VVVSNASIFGSLLSTLGNTVPRGSLFFFGFLGWYHPGGRRRPPRTLTTCTPFILFLSLIFPRTLFFFHPAPPGRERALALLFFSPCVYGLNCRPVGAQLFFNRQLSFLSLYPPRPRVPSWLLTTVNTVPSPLAYRRAAPLAKTPTHHPPS